MGRAEGGAKALKLLTTLLVMYVVSGVLLLVIAFLLYKFRLSEQVVSIAILAVYIVSGVLGGIMIGKKMKTRKFIWGLVMGGLYFAVLIIGSLVMNQGIGSDVVHVGTTFAICLAAGMVGGMIS